MRYRRKPIYYEAEQTDDNKWVITNLVTKERKVLMDREFRTQFEPVPEDKKPVPVDNKGKAKYPPLIVDLNEETGEIRFREVTDGE